MYLTCCLLVFYTNLTSNIVHLLIFYEVRVFSQQDNNFYQFFKTVTVSVSVLTPVKIPSPLVMAVGGVLMF